MAEERVLRLGVDPRPGEAGFARFRRAAGQTQAASDLVSAAVEKMALTFAGFFSARHVLGVAQDFARLETAMAEVSTLTADTSGLDAMTDAVERMAVAFGRAAPEQARALYQVISAGASEAGEAMEILDASNRLAIGGITSVETAADGLTTVLNAYGSAAGSVTDVSDALFVAMRAGKTTVDELSQSIGTVAPIAAQAGVSIEEVLSAAAALTKGGQDTSEAMRGLRQVIASVVKPSSEAADLAGRLGVQFNATALEAQGLSGFLQTLTGATGGSTEQMAQLFGGVEALVPILALTGEGAADFADTLENMGERAGATEEAFGRMSDTLEVRIDQIQQRFAAWERSIIEGAVPAVEVMLDHTDELADAMVSLALAVGAAGATAAFVAFGPAIAGATAAFVALVPAINSTSAALALLQVAIGPTGWAILGVSALAGGIYGVRRAMRESEEDIRRHEEALAGAAEQMGALNEAATLATLENLNAALLRAQERVETLSTELRNTQAEGPFTVAADVAELEEAEQAVDDILALIEAASLRWTEFGQAVADVAGGGGGGGGGGLPDVLELAEAIGDEIDLWARALDAGVIASASEMAGLEQDMLDRAAEIRTLLENQNLTLEEQVVLKERLLEIERERQALERGRRFQEDVEGGEAPPRREFSPTAQFGLPSLDAIGPDLAAEIEASARRIRAQIEATADAEEQAKLATNAAALTLVSGIAQVADGFGLVDEESRAAVQGLVGVVQGLQALSRVDLGALFSGEDLSFENVIGAVGGTISIIGGIATAIGGFFESADREAARIEEARQNFEDALDAYVDELADDTRWQALRGDAEEGAREALDALVEAAFAGLPDKVRDDVIKDVQDAFDDLDTEKLKELLAQFGPEGQEILDAYLQHLEKIEQQRQDAIATMSQNLQVETLRLQGLDDEADALALSIRYHDLMAEAIALEDQALQDTVNTWYAAAEAAREAAAAAREEAEAKRQANAAADFATDLAILQAQNEGNEELVRTLELQAQAAARIRDAKELLEEGIIDEAAFQAFVEAIGINLKNALEDAEQAALDAAAAEQFRADQDLRNLQVQLLSAQGRSEEALILRQQIQLLDAIENERSDEYIATLKQLHAQQRINLERERQAQAMREQERATVAVKEAAEQAARVFNAPRGLIAALYKARTLREGVSPDVFRPSGSLPGATSGAGGGVTFQLAEGAIRVDGGGEGDPEATGRGILRGMVSEAEFIARAGGGNLFALVKA